MADHTITLTAAQEAALADAVARHNAERGTTLTSGEYFSLKALEQVNTLVRVYRDRRQNLVTGWFEALSTGEQDAFLSGNGLVLALTPPVRPE
jgi:DNA-binding transcriptional regulator YbjK